MGSIKDLLTELKSKKFQTDNNIKKIKDDFEESKEPKIRELLTEKLFNFLGTKYRGEIKDNNPHGLGSILYPVQDIYKGEFFKGLKHGLGKYSYIGTGEKNFHPDITPYYIGEWFCDSNEGLGESLITKFEELSIYEGYWKNNRINGFGTWKNIRNIYNSSNPTKELIGYFKDDRIMDYGIHIERDNEGELVKVSVSGLYFFDYDKGTMTPVHKFKNIKEWDEIVVDKNHKNIIFDVVKKSIIDATDNHDFREFKLDFSVQIKNLMKNSLDTWSDNEYNNEQLDWFKEINKLNREVLSYKNIQELSDGLKKIKELKVRFNSIPKD